jgi:hypothetical protein
MILVRSDASDSCLLLFLLIPAVVDVGDVMEVVGVLVASTEKVGGGQPSMEKVEKKEQASVLVRKKVAGVNVDGAWVTVAVAVT